MPINKKHNMGSESASKSIKALAKWMIRNGRKVFTIGNLMSILGERQLLECSLAVLQQSPDLSNTLLPAKHIAGQLREDKQTSLRIQN